MAMMVQQVNTAASLAAVGKIKALVRNDGLGLSFDIPKEFLEKRRYMQSDNFIKDKQNAEMFDLIDKMMMYRDKITEEIKMKNETAKEEIVQGINGFSRIKKYLDMNKKLNYSENQTFSSHAENMYGIYRKYHVGNLSRQIKNQLNIVR